MISEQPAQIAIREIPTREARLSPTAQARRAQIVAATVRVIAREGLSQATFDRIAATAGLSSPGMISYHFADKDDLLVMVCESVLADCVAAIESAVQAADRPREALAAYLVAFVRWQDDNRDEVGALWRLAAGWKAPGQRAAFDEAALLAPLVRVLRAGQENGELRPVPIEWVAHTILCAVEGFHDVWRREPDTDADAFSSTLVAMFAHGLAVGDPE